MKARNIITLATIAASLLVGAASCDQKPDLGGEKGEGGKVENIDLTGYDKLNVAVKYYGDYYENETANYSIELYKGEVDEEGYFVGEAVDVTLDLCAPNGDASALPSGTYKLVASDTPGAWQIAASTPVTVKEYLDIIFAIFNQEPDYSDYTEEELAEVYTYGGSSYYSQQNDSTYTYAPLDDATLVVSNNNGTYTLAAIVCADGETYKYAYQGQLVITDGNEDDDEDDDDDDEGEFINIADYLALPSTDTASYYMYGVISKMYGKSTDTVYGNFYLKDEDGDEILIYGLLTPDGEQKKAWQEYGLEVDDEIIIEVTRAMYEKYNGTDEIKNAIYVYSSAEDSVPDGDLDLTVTEAYAYSDGDYWGDGTEDWCIYLYTGEDGYGMDWLSLELVSETASELPVGTYNIPAEFAEELPAGTMVPCYEAETTSGGSDYFGTYYGYGENYPARIPSSGSTVVSKNGEVYTIKVNFIDEDSDVVVKASFTGALSSDDEGDDDSALSSPRMSHGFKSAAKVVKLECTGLRMRKTIKNHVPAKTQKVELKGKKLGHRL